MARLRLLIILPLLAFIMLAPSVTFAAGFFGPIVPAACHCDTQAIQGGSGTANSAPDYGCVLAVIQNLVQFAVSLGVILCVLWIAYAGFSLMVSGGSAEARSQGKTRIMNAIIGIVVILAAWLVVNFVMNVLYNGTFGSWNSILAGDPAGKDHCITPNQPTAITAGSVASNITTVAPGTGASSVGEAGSCTVPTVGPCTVTNLGAFGSVASQAAQICTAESGNNATRKGDYTTQGYPVSFGLFQINITVHQIAGLNCPAAFNHVAFTGSNHNVPITNQNLYQQCASAAMNPSNNIATAASIYTGDNGSWREWSTHTQCGLTYMDKIKFAFVNSLHKLLNYE